MFTWYKSWTVWGLSLMKAGDTFSDPNFDPSNVMIWFNLITTVVGIIGARKAVSKINLGGSK